MFTLLVTTVAVFAGVGAATILAPTGLTIGLVVMYKVLN
jgi:hypothetical protein